MNSRRDQGTSGQLYLLIVAVQTVATSGTIVTARPKTNAGSRWVCGGEVGGGHGGGGGGGEG